jgi:hypothetical protein
MAKATRSLLVDSSFLVEPLPEANQDGGAGFECGRVEHHMAEGHASKVDSDDAGGNLFDANGGFFDQSGGHKWGMLTVLGLKLWDEFRRFDRGGLATRHQVGRRVAKLEDSWRLDFPCVWIPASS